MERFRKLGITESVIKSIEEQRFEKPSTIQEKSIPLILSGKDVIAGSATGSGKTLVFGSGVIQKTEHGLGIQALILTPTRELAEQVAKSLKKFSKYQPLDINAIYGGVSINPQIENLKKTDIVVGTPGRILDHIKRNTINLSKLKILVLDEADRMFEMGFKEDVELIINNCPSQRQTMLFSATIFEDIVQLAQRYMKNPVKVYGDTYVDPSKMHQIYYDVADKMKYSLLVHLLKNEKAGLVMVFCNTRSNTNFVANNLTFSGIEAMAIHGGFSQEKRNFTINKFSSEKVYVLVCTDLAARGLDIKGVSHVYNYDIPKDSKNYIHRAGRTARAGKEGKVINILCSHDYDNFARVLKDNSITITKESLPVFEKARIGWVENIKNRRMNDKSMNNRGFWKRSVPLTQDNNRYQKENKKTYNNYNNSTNNKEKSGRYSNNKYSNRGSTQNNRFTQNRPRRLRHYTGKDSWKNS